MQKFFAFYLLSLALILALCQGCSFNPNTQGKGQVYLQGQWQQDSVAGEKQLLEYAIYHLKFSCDSFFIQVNSYSKVNSGPDTCMRSGHWSEYIKGTYQQRSDTLHLKGQFCNRDYTIKEEGGCFRAGVYEESFVVSKKSDSLMQFASTSSVIPIRAHLINRTTCHPKPL